METELIDERRKEIEAYSPMLQVLDSLKERHLNVIIDVSSASGMALAKEGRRELKDLRLSLEKARKAEKEDSLAWGRYVDSEAKRIYDVIFPMEERYDFEIKKEEKRIADEKAERIRILELEIQKKKEEEAEKIRAEMEEKLKAERLAKEEAEKKLAEEREKMRLEREAFEKEKKIIEEQRLKIEREEKERMLKIEREEKAARLLKEESERADRLKKEAELRVIREEKEKIEAEERRIVREKEEKEAEIKRQINLKKTNELDGISLLTAFLIRYEEDEFFSPVIVAIKEFLG